MASLIDLHTHTSHSSACSHMTAEELIEAAIKAGLDGVAVTEHLVIEGAEVAQELARRKYGFPVFRGIEAHAAIFGDVLVFGCYQDLAPRIPWPALRQIVDQDGGVLIPAHPFRRWDRLALWRYLEEQALPLNGRLARMGFMQGLTAIEVQNSGCKPRENDQAAELARILALPGVGGSDAHSTAQVGQSATWFPNRITTDAGLIAALKQGGYRAAVRRRKGS
jgi:predicted metal-dependent phosphoesterase TrpH